MPQKLSRVDPQRVCYLSKHCNARRNFAALDRANIARAQSGALGQLLLRQILIVAFPTQVSRHDLLKIHGMMGALTGMIVPGTIVPIRIEA
jgi:hypothetical protein